MSFVPVRHVKRFSKYRNKRVTVDGIEYDSQGEAARHQALKLLERAGQINNLRHHPVFKLWGRNGTQVAEIEWDFWYYETIPGQSSVSVIEDWKGVRTEGFELKLKLFHDCHPGHTIRLTGPWEKILEKKRKKARDKYAAKKAALGRLGDSL